VYIEGQSRDKVIRKADLKKRLARVDQRISAWLECLEANDAEDVAPKLLLRCIPTRCKKDRQVMLGVQFNF